MNIDPYIEQVRQQAASVAETGGPEMRELAERLLGPLESALRLAIQDALAGAAQEITLELAPGAVDLRLRGREPEFVVTPPPPEAERGEVTYPIWEPDDADRAQARINLRLPARLKERVEEAAGGEGLSVNTWLVRAAGSALERSDRGRPKARLTPGSQRFKGWVG